MNGIARDARAAWTDLVAMGGIELGGRDEGFEAALLEALPVELASLDDALDLISTDDLVRGVFAVVEPYTKMFRAILEFFRAAGARQGRDHWSIAVEDEHFDLEDFVSYLEAWDSIETELDVAAVDWKSPFEIARAPRKALSVGDVGAAGSDDEQIYPPYEGKIVEFHPPEPTGIAAINLWLKEYRAGRYPPFPAHFHPLTIRSELRELAALGLCITDILRENWRDRDHMMNDYWRRMGPKEQSVRWLSFEEADGFALGTIAQNETDYLLGHVIIALVNATQAPSDRLTLIGDMISSEVARFPRRTIGIRSNAAMLERILSLPLWRERHALYAVWIATELMRACHGHDIEIHHEDGRIAFAFKKTLIATIRSAEPVRYLYSERRVPLENAVGNEKQKGAQPDYSLWRGTAAIERCDLVVEVKHYKRAARRRFADVMTNYATAHPVAAVALVNHGPIGDVCRDMPNNIAARCHPLGELSAANQLQRNVLRALVRATIGAPLRRSDAQSVALCIDVSGSMEAVLGSEVFAQWYSEQTGAGASAVVAVDVEIVFQGRGDTPLATLLRYAKRRGTSFVGPIGELIGKFDTIIVATDDDGIHDLALAPGAIDASDLGGGLRIATVRRVEES